MKMGNIYWTETYGNIYKQIIDSEKTNTVFEDVLPLLKQIARDQRERDMDEMKVIIESLNEVHVPENRSNDFTTGFLMAIILSRGKLLNSIAALREEDK